MRHTFSHRRSPRRILAAFLGPMAALGVLAAAVPPSHHALAAQRSGPHASLRPKPGARGPLTQSQALARARATHHRVTVTALTTPYAITTASPSGSFTLTQTLRPTRAWRHGAWVPLNATLHRGPGRTVVPAVTAAALQLSGGGSGPLAVLDEAGYPLSLTWPTPLPTPTLSGDTATYPNVLPGVDLLITVDTQGNVTTTLAIRTAAAAANPALSSLQITESAPGLTLAADSWGSLSWTASPQGDPVFTSPGPQMWDSAPLPPGTLTVTEPDGSVVAQGSGAPAASTSTAPGGGASVTQVPVTVTGDTITLAPPASALTGPNITYPVYIDPSFYPDPVGKEATHWTEVESGFPGTTGWDEGSELQVGECDNSQGTCHGIGVARSFFRMPVSTFLAGSTIQDADLFMTNDWAASVPSCTPEPVDLHTTGKISKDTSWSNQPAWGSLVEEKSFAHGGQNCPVTTNNVDWNVKDAIQDDADNAATDQTFGLRAPDEGQPLQWKKFLSGSEKITMTITYTLPPARPDRTTSPGGACWYSPTGAPVIGNDDVTFYATAYDATLDSNQLSTEFFIVDPATGKPLYTSTVTTGDGDTAQIIVPRATMAGLDPSPGSNGGVYTYYWYALVTNSAGQTSTSPTDNCYFTYNPNGPSQPEVTLSPDNGPLGTPVSATFQTPGCGSAASPCPVSYTYQQGVATPVTVSQSSPSGGTWNGSTWNGPITITQRGVIQFSVYGTTPGGNVSEAATPLLTGVKPASAYPDGYFTGTEPSLLLAGSGVGTATGSATSLWLYPGGSRDGTLGAPVDIGSLGTTFPASGQANDGPADWNTAQVLHGDFTTNLVQDVMAYYPAAVNGLGAGAILPGNGNASTLDPGGTTGIQAGSLQDPITGTSPIQVVAAGDASQQQNSGTPDLIGITANATSYQLDLYQGCGVACWDATNPPTVLSSTPPDTKNNNTWSAYTLATAQPGGASSTVLFALDTITGTLWECTNPGAPLQTPPSPISWTSIAVPWGASPPTLVSADVNASGAVELWTTNFTPATPATPAIPATTATSYKITGTAPSLSLAKEAANSLSLPSDEWPLTDGNPSAQGLNAATATDTTGGNTATRAGTANGTAWAVDDYFQTDISLDNQNSQTGYLPASSGTVPSTDPDPTLSVWFKTTTNGGVIASLQDTTIASGGPATTYDPILYVGSDGYLYAQWYTGKVAPLISNSTSNPVIVDDGLWHHAVLTTTGSGSGTTQTLTVDGKNQGSLTGALSLQGDTSGNTNLTFGAGYTGGKWPAEPNQGNTSKPDYFQGQIADITFNQ